MEYSIQKMARIVYLDTRTQTGQVILMIEDRRQDTYSCIVEEQSPERAKSKDALHCQPPSPNMYLCRWQLRKQSG